METKQEKIVKESDHLFKPPENDRGSRLLTFWYSDSVDHIIALYFRRPVIRMIIYDSRSGEVLGHSLLPNDVLKMYERY